jgi:hypothetical protein
MSAWQDSVRERSRGPERCVTNFLCFLFVFKKTRGSGRGGPISCSRLGGGDTDVISVSQPKQHERVISQAWPGLNYDRSHLVLICEI